LYTTVFEQTLVGIGAEILEYNLFEQMRSLQTGVVIKVWMSTTYKQVCFFKSFDGHYPSDNNRF